MKKLKNLASIALTIGLGLQACTQSPPTATQTSDKLQGKLVLTGSSTVAPLAAEIGKRFESKHPDVRVDVQTGGSSRGIADARSGVANIGMASRSLKEEEKDLQSFAIARDGIGIILHKDNPLKSLSNQQVIDIYTGKVNNWQQVGGKNAPITVINKAEGRSTLELFLDYFKLENSQIKASAVIGDNQQGIKTVAGNPNAIGYVSIGTAEFSINNDVSLKLLPLNGIAWSFISDRSWHPVEGLYNLMPMLWASILVTLGAVLLAAPLGIGSAIFCQYYAPPLIARFYRQLIELLAGIPSVVYGFWGLVVLVPLINRLQAPGTSLLAGIAILTLMILPTIALTAEASFTEVPPEYFQGAAALGISPWATICSVIIPAAKSGLFTGLILGTGRAIGETMAVLMVCGNVVQTPTSLFDPVRTLTANIALEMAYATGNHRSALFVSGLLLMIAIAALVAFAEAMSRRNIYG